ncbi:hypothetical protein [Streptomyces cinereoruber]|uniref:hypothetical protein n=1 Tax=Streptomyces cinereoruber TaxID=67260 RepID=UPI0036641D74
MLNEEWDDVRSTTVEQIIATLAGLSDSSQIFIGEPYETLEVVRSTAAYEFFWENEYNQIWVSPTAYQSVQSAIWDLAYPTLLQVMCRESQVDGGDLVEKVRAALTEALPLDNPWPNPQCIALPVMDANELLASLEGVEEWGSAAPTAQDDGSGDQSAGSTNYDTLRTDVEQVVGAAQPDGWRMEALRQGALEQISGINYAAIEEAPIGWSSNFTVFQHGEKPFLSIGSPDISTPEVAAFYAGSGWDGAECENIAALFPEKYAGRVTVTEGGILLIEKYGEKSRQVELIRLFDRACGRKVTFGKVTPYVDIHEFWDRGRRTPLWDDFVSFVREQDGGAQWIDFLDDVAKYPETKAGVREIYRDHMARKESPQLRGNDFFIPPTLDELQDLGLPLGRMKSTTFQFSEDVYERLARYDYHPKVLEFARIQFISAFPSHYLANFYATRY